MCYQRFKGPAVCVGVLLFFGAARFSLPPLGGEGWGWWLFSATEGLVKVDGGVDGFHAVLYLAHLG